MSLRERTRLGVGIIEPGLPSPAKAPPSGPGWLHEIKHDGFRILARRDSAGVRLFHGNDFTARFPLAVEAAAALSARLFLLDGEAIVTDDKGRAVFDLIRHKRHGEAGGKHHSTSFRFCVYPACRCVSVPAPDWGLSYPLPLRLRLPAPDGCTK
jgi:ATP-dependent DNA ligase